MWFTRGTNKTKKRLFSVSGLQALSTSNAEAVSSIKSGKGFRASTTFSVFLKRYPTPAVIDVDVETHVEPQKLSKMANLVIKGSYRHHPNRSVTALSDHRAHAGCNEMEDGGEGSVKEW